MDLFAKGRIYFEKVYEQNSCVDIYGLMRIVEVVVNRLPIL